VTRLKRKEQRNEIYQLALALGAATGTIPPIKSASLLVVWIEPAEADSGFANKKMNPNPTSKPPTPPAAL